MNVDNVIKTRSMRGENIKLPLLNFNAGTRPGRHLVFHRHEVELRLDLASTAPL